MTLTAEEVLAAAAARVERGWTQGALDWEGRQCAVGALLATCGFSSWSDYFAATTIMAMSPRASAVLAAARAMYKEITGIYSRTRNASVLCGELALWNDHPRRTAEEVATTLRNAKRHLPTPEP